MKDEVLVYNNKIEVLSEKTVHNELGYDESKNCDFNDFVHFICKIKNVRKHGRGLLFYDSIYYNPLEDTKNANTIQEASFFYTYHLLDYNNKSYVLKNEWDSKNEIVGQTMQLIVSKKFYADDKKFEEYQKCVLKGSEKESNTNLKELEPMKQRIQYAERLRNIYFNNLTTSIFDKETIKESICRKRNNETHLPLYLNEYVHNEYLSKLIKPDTIVYVIGLPILTNTNEKSVLIFSAYILQIQFEFFPINVLFKLFEQNLLSMLTIYTSVGVDEIYIQNMYNTEHETRKKKFLDLIYKFKSYESVSNQKMNNFEIFILKTIDQIPQLLHVEVDNSLYEFGMNEQGIIAADITRDQRKEIIRKVIQEMIKDVLVETTDVQTNKQLYNDYVECTLCEPDPKLKGKKKKKKKLRKKQNKDIKAYMNDKKIPQILCMIQHIREFMKNSEKKNEGNRLDYYIKETIPIDERRSNGNWITESFKILINNYVESKSCLHDTYAEFLYLFMKKNRGLFDEKNIKKLEDFFIIRTDDKEEEKELKSHWKNFEFYHMNELYNKDINERSYDYCILDIGGGKGDLGLFMSMCFHNVLVLILDINVSSLFSCFMKIYCNKVKNVIIIHESILDFDFQKCRIDIIVGLHFCGGLSDYILKTCMDLRIPFLICSCCYTKFKKLRKFLFDFTNEDLIRAVQNYIYQEDGWKLENILNDEVLNCSVKREHTKECHDELKRNEFLHNEVGIEEGKDSFICEMVPFENSKEIHSKSIKPYDKYETKVLRRTIPNVYSFINLLSKLCESDNREISSKSMHFYNTLRFIILKKLFYKIRKTDNEQFNFSLHSFPTSFSPKNIVLKGTFI